MEVESTWQCIDYDHVYLILNYVIGQSGRVYIMQFVTDVNQPELT
jgi:hypothetical protein